MIIGIWAQDKNGLIGKNGSLPWHLPAELAHFKKTTLNEAILMGRKTFEGMNKRILPKRQTIVLTRDTDYDSQSSEVLLFHNKEQVLDWYKKQDKDLYIIGGAEILSSFEGNLDRIYRTTVDGEFSGDVYFPKDFSMDKFEKISQKKYANDEKNAYDFEVEYFARK